MNPNIYLHEIIRTVPGREEPYMASVLSVHNDGSRRRGEQARGAFGQFRSAGVSGGWPGAINIWENSWSGQARDLERQFQDAERDTAMEEWWNRNLHLRQGGYDRILVPAPFSPTRAELRERGAHGKAFLHEILWLPFGEPERYLEELERGLLPAAQRHGIELIGAFQVAMRPRQVLTLLGAAEWAHLGSFLEAAETDPELRAWHEYRSSCVARSEEMVLIPARHDPLASSGRPSDRGATSRP
ncbi:MAG: hypothetical protein VX681_07765 [Myxococcota bacterium]|jgi:hypothetical protein|nr:hypothetical protein [Myxococcota bacterium]